MPSEVARGPGVRRLRSPVFGAGLGVARLCLVWPEGAVLWAGGLAGGEAAVEWFGGVAPGLCGAAPAVVGWGLEVGAVGGGPLGDVREADGEADGEANGEADGEAEAGSEVSGARARKHKEDREANNISLCP